MPALCYRANMAQVRQSRQDSGLGFLVKILQRFSVVPSSLGSGQSDGAFATGVYLERVGEHASTFFSSSLFARQQSVSWCFGNGVLVSLVLASGQSDGVVAMVCLPGGCNVSRSETPGASSGLPSSIERMAPTRQSRPHSGLGQAIFWVVLR